MINNILNVKKQNRSSGAGSLLILMILILFAVFQKNGNAQNKIVFSTVDEAIALALKNNSEVIISGLNKLKAESEVSQEYSRAFVPDLSLSSEYFRTFKKQVINIFGQTFETGADNNIITSFRLREDIPFLGNPAFAGVNIANSYLKLQEENLVSVENDIKKNVKKSYFEVQLAKSVVEINKLTLDNAQSNFNEVNARYRNGVATEFDYLRAKVKVDNILPVLSKSERTYEISKKALSNSIGLKTDNPVEVTGYLTYDSNEVWGSTEDLINSISENNVSVRQLLINNQISKELVTVDKAEYLPKFYLYGVYNISASSNDNRSIFNYPFFNSLNAGLGFSWNLNFIRNSYKVDQSKIEVKKSEEQIKDAKQKLRLLSESVIIAMDDARQRLKSQRATILLAERGVDLANASYRAGVLNQIDVQDAELILYQSRLSYMQAIYDYQIAKAELEKLLER